MRRHLAKAGIHGARELDWWQHVEVAGLRVTYVPAQHFSARTPWDRNRSLWGGFVIEAPDGGTVYFAGDSGWCPHFDEIGRALPAHRPGADADRRLCAALLHADPAHGPGGGGAWRIGRCGARRSIGMHFGTFAGLTDEPIEEPEARLAEAKAAQGVAAEAFVTLPFGATLEIAAAG